MKSIFKTNYHLPENKYILIALFAVMMIMGCSKDEDYSFVVKVISHEGSIPVEGIKIKISEKERGYLAGSKTLTLYECITDSNGMCIIPLRFHKYEHIYYYLQIKQEITDPVSGNRYLLKVDRYLSEDDFKKNLTLTIK